MAPLRAESGTKTAAAKSNSGQNLCQEENTIYSGLLSGTVKILWKTFELYRALPQPLFLCRCFSASKCSPFLLDAHPDDLSRLLQTGFPLTNPAAIRSELVRFQARTCVVRVEFQKLSEETPPRRLFLEKEVE
jgi:hypothetical protein